MQTFEQVETLLYLFNDFKACINYTEGIRARLISRHNPRNSHTKTLKTREHQVSVINFHE